MTLYVTGMVAVVTRAAGADTPLVVAVIVTVAAVVLAVVALSLARWWRGWLRILDTAVGLVVEMLVRWALAGVAVALEERSVRTHALELVAAPDKDRVVRALTALDVPGLVVVAVGRAVLRRSRRVAATVSAASAASHDSACAGAHQTERKQRHRDATSQWGSPLSRRPGASHDP
jgi:hypothetical protein